MEDNNIIIKRIKSQNFKINDEKNNNNYNYYTTNSSSIMGTEFFYKNLHHSPHFSESYFTFITISLWSHRYPGLLNGTINNRIIAYNFWKSADNFDRNY